MYRVGTAKDLVSWEVCWHPGTLPTYHLGFRAVTQKANPIQKEELKQQLEYRSWGAEQDSVTGRCWLAPSLSLLFSCSRVKRGTAKLRRRLIIDVWKMLAACILALLILHGDPVNTSIKIYPVQLGCYNSLPTNCCQNGYDVSLFDTNSRLQ